MSRVYEVKCFQAGYGFYSDFKTACDKMKFECEIGFSNDPQVELRQMIVKDDRTDEISCVPIFAKYSNGEREEVGVVKCHNVK